jgi:hypothetical protein
MCSNNKQNTVSEKHIRHTYSMGYLVIGILQYSNKGEIIMCLHNEEQATNYDEQINRYVWKVFNKTKDNKLTSIKFGTDVFYNKDKTYTSDYGFFAFINKVDANALAKTCNEMHKRDNKIWKSHNKNVNKFVVKKVKIKGIMAKGFCGFNQKTLLGEPLKYINAIRFKEMKILE